jgi:probable HAF family extracellular repeat protein
MQNLTNLTKYCVLFFVALCLFGSAGIVRAQGSAPAYTITDLGALNGYSEPFAINATGTVAGQSYTTNGVYHGVRWSKLLLKGLSSIVILSDLGTLGGDNSCAYGINAQGVIVGQSNTPGKIQYAHACVFPSTDLGTLGGQNSAAYGVNTNQVKVGWAQNELGLIRPCLWSASNSPTDIGTLGGPQGTAYGVNDAGQIAGWSDPASGFTHACLWDQRGIRDLGALILRGRSAAFGINASEQVCGTSDAVGGFRAFLWDNGNGMRSLGTPYPNPPFNYRDAAGNVYRVSMVNTFTGKFAVGVHTGTGGINDRGDVVGYAELTTNKGVLARGFLYTNGQMVDLNTLLSANSGWTLLAGRAINNNGQIAGWGEINGQLHAFLMTPPDRLVLLEVSKPRIGNNRGGQTVSGMIEVTGSNPGIVVVQLASSNPQIAQVPANRLVIVGELNYFNITTNPVKMRTTVTISATYNGTTLNAPLVLDP